MEFQQKNLLQLKVTYLFFQIWIEDNLNNQNFKKAVKYYFEEVLDPLVGLLEAKNQRFNSYNFSLTGSKLKPQEVTSLVDLYMVQSPLEMKQKSRLVGEVIDETLQSLEKL